MKDFVYTIKQNDKRLVVNTLYLPDSHVWEIFIETAIENVVYIRVDGTDTTRPLLTYDTMQKTAENVYHDEKWSIDAGEFWDWVDDNEMNLTLAGQGDEVYLHKQTENEFYNDSDNGYFALGQWITEWLSEYIILLDD